jgi:hypothetical protein
MVRFYSRKTKNIYSLGEGRDFAWWQFYEKNGSDYSGEDWSMRAFFQHFHYFCTFKVIPKCLKSVDMLLIDEKRLFFIFHFLRILAACPIPAYRVCFH